jgi:hypothetical protein
MGVDSIIEAIGMGSIIVEVMVEGKIERICIKDAYIASKFVLDEQVFVKWLKVHLT